MRSDTEMLDWVINHPDAYKRWVRYPGTREQIEVAIDFEELLNSIPPHVCGSGGFGMGINDICPSCEFWRDHTIEDRTIKNRKTNLLLTKHDVQDITKKIHYLWLRG